jgi:hypothetical protein
MWYEEEANAAAATALYRAGYLDIFVISLPNPDVYNACDAPSG